MIKTISQNYDSERIIRQKLEEDLNNGGEISRFFFGIAYPIVNDFHETEDAVQNALMGFWEKAGYYSHSVNKGAPLLKDRRIKTYMWEICKNSAIDVVKERAKFRKVNILSSDYLFCKENDYAHDGNNPLLEELAVSEKTPISLAIKSEEKKLVAKIIPELSKCLRGVVKMFYYNGKAYKEIAEELKIPIGTVKSRLNKAKYLLREKLKESPLFNVHN